MDLLLCDDVIFEILKYINHGGDFITLCCVVKSLYEKCMENKKLIEHITFYCNLFQGSFLKKVDHFDKIILRRSEFSEVERIKEKIIECISNKVDLKFECGRCKEHKDIEHLFGVTEIFYLRCKECKLKKGEKIWFNWIIERKGRVINRF